MLARTLGYQTDLFFLEKNGLIAIAVRRLKSDADWQGVRSYAAAGFRRSEQKWGIWKNP